jgi:hypothetical protein
LNVINTTSNNPTLSAALDYSTLGYPSFPLVPRTKRPATAHGHKDATTDPETLQALFRNHHNLGVAWPTGVLAIDLDVPKDANHEPLPGAREYADSFAEEYEDTYPELRAAPRVRSRADGVVWIVRLPDGITLPSKVNAVQLEGGGSIDLRGDGRTYTAAPPSIMPPGIYTWERNLVAPNELPIATAALIAHLTSPQPSSNNNSAPSTPTTSGAGAAKTLEGDPSNFAAGLLAGVRTRLGATQTGRNTACYNEGLTLGRWIGGYANANLAGLNEHEATEALRDGMRTNGDYNDGTDGPQKAENTIRRALHDGIASAYHVTHTPRTKAAPIALDTRDPNDPGPTDIDAPAELLQTKPPSAPWNGPDPQPFPPSTRTAPTLPDDLLPEPLYSWAKDAAKRASATIDMFVPGLLVSLAATVGNRWRIRPKQHDPWTVVPNLWGLLVQPAGQMKSFAMGAATRPIRAIEEHERASYKLNQNKHDVDAITQDTTHGALMDELTKLIKKRASTAEIERVKRDLVDAKNNADRHPKPKMPTLVANDSTVEALIELLRDNPRGMLLYRDELNGWYEGLQKQGREGDRAFYLETHDGDRPYSQHRIGRGHVQASIVTLSILGGIQPSKLTAIQRGAISGRDADGLLQRFQILVWPDKFNRYQLDDREAAHDLDQQLADVYRAVYDLNPSHHGFADGEPGITRFDPDAQKLFFEWLEGLEQNIRAPETQIKPAWASYLGKTRSLMPTIALLFHLLDMASGRANSISVTTEATQRAIRATTYLAGHAAKVYGPELDREIETARLIVEKIADRAIRDGTTVREIYNNGWAGLDRPSVEEGLRFLETLGWLRITRTTTTNGGRPKTIVQLHPKTYNLAIELSD